MCKKETDVPEVPIRCNLRPANDKLICGGGQGDGSLVPTVSPQIEVCGKEGQSLFLIFYENEGLSLFFVFRQLSVWKETLGVTTMGRRASIHFAAGRAV